MNTQQFLDAEKARVIFGIRDTSNNSTPDGAWVNSSGFVSGSPWVFEDEKEASEALENIKETAIGTVNQKWTDVLEVQRILITEKRLVAAMRKRLRGVVTRTQLRQIYPQHISYEARLWDLATEVVRGTKLEPRSRKTIFEHLLGKK